MSYQSKANSKMSEFINRVPGTSVGERTFYTGIAITALQLLAAIADELHDLNKKLEKREE